MTLESSPQMPPGRHAFVPQSECATQPRHSKSRGSQLSFVGSVQSTFDKQPTHTCEPSSQNGCCVVVHDVLSVHIIGGTSGASLRGQCARSSGFFSQYSALRFSQPASSATRTRTRATIRWS